MLMREEFRFCSRLFTLLFAYSVVVACPVAGAQQKLVIDPARSEVHFTLSDVLHTVHGTFQIERGQIVFDPVRGQASGSIVVDGLSGKSGNATRDRRMAKDELKTESYRSITFAPSQLTGTFHASGDSSLQVHGLFTILGTAHEIDVPIEVQVSGDQLHATGKFDVPYVQWGMKDPSTLMLRVSKEVHIDLLLTGTLQR